jgi:hypothetical protein
MVESGEQPGFALKWGGSFFVTSKLGRHDLDGDRAAELRVAGAVTSHIPALPIAFITS